MFAAQRKRPTIWSPGPPLTIRRTSFCCRRRTLPQADARCTQGRATYRIWAWNRMFKLLYFNFCSYFIDMDFFPVESISDLLVSRVSTVYTIILDLIERWFGRLKDCKVRFYMVWCCTHILRFLINIAFVALKVIKLHFQDYLLRCLNNCGNGWYVFRVGWILLDCIL